MLQLVARILYSDLLTDGMADLLNGHADVAEGERMAVLYAAVDGSVGALSHEGTSVWKVITTRNMKHR